MPTPVVMPQMGESIAEGTIVRWIKKVGDHVDRDEPLLEISTDKVDAEIPAPASGVLTEITVGEGETVPVNSVVGTIAAATAGAAAPPPPAASDAHEVETGREDASRTTQAQPDGAGDRASAQPSPSREEAPSAADAGAQRSSPLVRKMAKEHRIDIAQVPGTGAGGRVTKNDVLQFLAGGARGAPDASPAPRPAQSGGDGRVEVQPLSIMRRKIAEHMVLSRRTSAHVHSVFHVGFNAVARIRERRKADYEGHGVKLTYMAFIAKAVSDALRRHPLLNASLDGTNVILRKDVNLGIAVAIEGGLIVPVVKNADERNMLGLSRAIADLAERARLKQLKPEEVHGGTFTITNPGQYGAQFGMPIINQPQVAILGIGTVEKRPVIIDDAIAIRSMAYLTLGYDHRLVDGATADQFMGEVKERIENFDETEV